MLCAIPRARLFSFAPEATAYKLKKTQNKRALPERTALEKKRGPGAHCRNSINPQKLGFS
jgi:hypothetical protein